MNLSGWLPLIQYYIHAFKTGEYPTIVTDQAFMWGRLYPKGADANDHVPKPNNWQWVCPLHAAVAVHADT